MELGRSCPFFWVQEQLTGSSCFTPAPVFKYGSFQISPGDPDNDWITGGKERVTVGPKSSGLPGDPDCCGTTVLVTDSWQGIVLHLISGKGTNKSSLWKGSAYYKVLYRVSEIGKFHIMKHKNTHTHTDLELGISEHNPGQAHWKQC